MPRKSNFTEQQKEQALKLRAVGMIWKDIAEHMGVSRDTLLYHCTPHRAAQVQKAIKKYQASNYEKVRQMQRECSANTRVQQKKS